MAQALLSYDYSQICYNICSFCFFLICVFILFVSASCLSSGCCACYVYSATCFYLLNLFLFLGEIASWSYKYNSFGSYWLFLGCYAVDDSHTQLI